jgi:hypothetical protein
LSACLDKCCRWSDGPLVVKLINSTRYGFFFEMWTP